MNANSTPTPKELADQFHGTIRPFAVWYNEGAGCDSRKWNVNDENGNVVKDFVDMATALKVAAKMERESGWDAEARKQARALAKVMRNCSDEDDTTDKLNKLIQHTYEFDNHLTAFFTMAETVSDSENNEEMDKLKFLLKAAKDRHFEFSVKVCEIEREVSHA